jgi:hypothetical protein
MSLYSRERKTCNDVKIRQFSSTSRCGRAPQSLRSFCLSSNFNRPSDSVGRSNNRGAAHLVVFGGHRPPEIIKRPAVISKVGKASVNRSAKVRSTGPL